MNNDIVHGVLLEAALDGREELRSTHGEDSDTYAILNAIFPLAGDGKGFRVEGFQHALEFLADRLAAIEDDSIAKRSKGRIYAMRPWMLLMVFYWHEAKGERPRIGHYQRDIGDYDSPAVAALSDALEQIDPEASSRGVVDALKQAEEAFDRDPTEPVVLLTFGLGPVVLAGEVVSTRETLARYLDMPPTLLESIWASGEGSKPLENRERSMVSKEEFFETLKSSEGGKILLRTLIENRRR